MTFDKKIEQFLDRYDFTEDQKTRFLIRAKAIVDSDIAKDYKVGIIAAVAEYIARENERQDELMSSLEEKRAGK